MGAKKAVRKVTRRPKTAPVYGALPKDVVLSPQSELPPGALRRGVGEHKPALQELSWSRFDVLVQGLAAKILRTFQPQAVVGVAHGGVFVGGALASAMACEFFPVRISRRSRDTSARKRPRMTGQMPPELKGRRVLICDDVAASGETLELAQTLARKAGASAIKTACLVSRPRGGYQPGWSALRTDALVIFPWDYSLVSEDSRFESDPDKAGA